MDNDKGFDPVEAIIILIGVIIVGGSIMLGVVMSLASSLPHHGGIF